MSQERLTNLLQRLSNPRTRLTAASEILSREVGEKEIAITQHFIGNDSSPETILANLMMERLSELEKKVSGR